MVNQKNIPVIVLALIILKHILIPFASFDAIAFVAASLLFGFKLFLDHKAQKDTEDLLEIVESNRKYLDDKINELDQVYTDAINKVDAKVTGHMIQKTQTPSSGTNANSGFGWGR
jgi:hypothetical protein